MDNLELHLNCQGTKQSLDFGLVRSHCWGDKRTTITAAENNNNNNRTGNGDRHEYHLLLGVKSGMIAGLCLFAHRWEDDRLYAIVWEWSTQPTLPFEAK